MKRFKYYSTFLVMALVVCLSLSSCLDSDESTVTNGNFVKLVYPYFYTSDGIQLIPTSLSTSSLTGTYYYLYYQYDATTEDASTGSVTVTLLSDPVCIDASESENPTSVDDEDYMEATNPLYSLSDVSSAVGFFDEDILIMPMLFWYYYVTTTSEYNAEIAKHSFYLAYDLDEFTSDATTLTLYINHVVEEESDGSTLTRVDITSSYRAYDLSEVLTLFKRYTSNYPTTISFKAYCNSMSDTLSSSYSQLDITYPYAD